MDARDRRRVGHGLVDADVQVRQLPGGLLAVEREHDAVAFGRREREQPGTRRRRIADAGAQTTPVPTVLPVVEWAAQYRVAHLAVHQVDAEVGAISREHSRLAAAIAHHDDPAAEEFATDHLARGDILRVADREPALREAALAFGRHLEQVVPARRCGGWGVHLRLPSVLRR